MWQILKVHRVKSLIINLLSGRINCLGKSVNLRLLIEAVPVCSIPLLLSKAVSCIPGTGTPEFLGRAVFSTDVTKNNMEK